MHCFEKKIAQVCREKLLLAEGDIVIAGISAGPDSMSMLYLLHSMKLQLNLKLIAAYVDHGLRPLESTQEQDFVRSHADNLGIDFETILVDVKAKSCQEKLSIEDAARQLRYQFFQELAGKYGATKIAVAHTADDQAEELLLRLIRGTGRKGLSGMDRVKTLFNFKKNDAKSDTVFCGNLQLIRPLLGESKEQIITYLDQINVSYLEDSTNSQNIYLRNRVRLELLPYLAKEFNPEIKTTLCQTAEILKDEEDLLNTMSQREYQSVVSETISEKLPKIVIDLAHLPDIPVAIARRVLEKAFWYMQARPSFRTINAILELTKKNGNGEQHFSQGLRVEKRDMQLVFSYPKGKSSFRGSLAEPCINQEEFFVSGPGKYSLVNFGIDLCFEVVRRDEKLLFGKENKLEYLDYDKLSFPLLIRSKRAGDRFHPLGARGSKKVGSFLGDLKIQKNRRQLVPVLLIDETIIALLGLRIDHAFRITKDTKQVLKIEIDKN